MISLTTRLVVFLDTSYTDLLLPLTTSLQLSSAPTAAPVYKKIIHRDGVEALLQQKLGLSELKVVDDHGNREILLKDKSGTQYTLYLS